MSEAIAHPNIALIKYWGKADDELIIPATSSISVTLEAFETRTTVFKDATAKADTASINGVDLEGEELKRVVELLDYIMQLARSDEHAQVSSTNTVPTAAGLASSASGFAALTVAAADAYGLKLSATELSRIARRGSGSATRSIFGDMVLWNAGTDDASSYAQQLSWQGAELEMVVAVISADKKAISSRLAMQITRDTSPFYDSWVTANNELVTEALGAIEKGDLNLLGELTELSTMRMHAVMLSSSPAIRYLGQQSFELLDVTKTLRAAGLQVFATADAGPNVKFLCASKDTGAIIDSLKELHPEITFLRSKIGGPAKVLG